MSTFQVKDMTCGHCASIIRNAIAAVDPQAAVSIDVAARRVEIASARADAAPLRGAIERAGYTPVVAQPDANTGTSERSSCGAGCGCG